MVFIGFVSSFLEFLLSLIAIISFNTITVIGAISVVAIIVQRLKYALPYAKQITGIAKIRMYFITYNKLNKKMALLVFESKNLLIGSKDEMITKIKLGPKQTRNPYDNVQFLITTLAITQATVQAAIKIK